MLDQETYALRDCIGREAVDREGDKIGKIDDVYDDTDTGRPEWFAITSGIFGKKVSFVPVDGAIFDGDRVVLAHAKERVKGAPSIDADGRLSDAEEEQLYRHYGVGTQGTARTMTEPSSRERGGRVRDDMATDAGTDDAMTRSEEEVRADKTARPVGRARLEKWVETEDVHFTVPVQREKARLVTEPITEGNRDRAMRGTDIRENEHEIVLNEEQVEVEKQVVPKERARLETETVTEQREIDEQVRKERIDLREDDADRTGRRAR